MAMLRRSFRPLLLALAFMFDLLRAGAMPAQTSSATSGTNSAVDASQYDFSGVSAAINAAIAQKKLPGAVVVVGHGGKVVFEQAYGVRKLAGEPGIDGKPSPAEPMTLDTIFDMASMTKVLVTATAVMQLYEQGKLGLDDAVVKYLPEFGVNGKEHVTIRELLTHYSGLPPDVDLKDAWGLAAPDKAEGLRRAMSAPLEHTPGTHFEYSDVNFVVLGALVEKLSGETLDVYANQHIFMLLGMDETGYRPIDLCNFPYQQLPPPGSCPAYRAIHVRPYHSVAPTAHDNEGSPTTNPKFDTLLRGTVHDPTTRRMGGVAGQAGVFSTAHDISLFAQALLDKLLHNTGPFPLQQSTLRLMTRPAQPATAESGATVFKQDGTTTTGVAQRGLGWDINSAYSRPRGTIFPTVYPAIVSSNINGVEPPSFGHTGFTGTSLWIDPASDTYVILLSNSVHPRGNPSISPLRGEVATAAAKALGVHSAYGCEQCPAALPQRQHIEPVSVPSTSSIPPYSINEAGLGLSEISGSDFKGPIAGFSGPPVLTGIDVLEQSHFSVLTSLAAQDNAHLRIGLLTNQTGFDSQGKRTIDILRSGAARAAGTDLIRLFSPEHGLFGVKDSNSIGQERDAASGLKVVSLYGAKDADKRPKPEDLRDLDAVVIDLQDAGARFYTYETVVGYFLEASACEATRGHVVEIVVLDRPDPIGGEAVEGPVSDTEAAYINYMPEPLRQGMTLGELARYMVAEHPGVCGARAKLTVVPMQGWRRGEYFDETGLRWVNPSPNLRSVEAEVLYPALGMLDYSNVSVGRGSETPFEVFGAGAEALAKGADATHTSWFDGKAVAAYLTARKIPGVAFAATRFAVAEDANRYPYHGQTIEGVRLTVTDRNALNSPELGIEILSALHHLYPAQFKLEKAAGLLANAETMAALERRDDPRSIAASWTADLDAFKARRAK